MSDPRHSHDPDDPDSEVRILTPGLAVWLTISASLFAWSLTLLLIGVNPKDPPFDAAHGIGVLLGYGSALLLSKPFIADPPGPSLGFSGAPAHAWIAAVLLVPSVLVFSELDNVISSVFPRPEFPESEVAARADLLSFAQTALSAVVIHPLVLEIYLRGLIQPRVAVFWGSAGAVFGVALLTTLASALHAPYPGGLALLFCNALMLGLVRRAAGSIAPCMLLSAGYGALATLARYEVFGIPGFDVVTPGSHTPLSVLVVPAMLMGIALALCRHAAKDLLTEPRRGSRAADYRER